MNYISLGKETLAIFISVTRTMSQANWPQPIRHIPPQDPDRWRLHGCCRKSTGGDNGRNGEAGKSFYIFQVDQRRAYHDNDHD